jgi:hypothetical protein
MAISQKNTITTDSGESVPSKDISPFEKVKAWNIAYGRTDNVNIIRWIAINATEYMSILITRRQHLIITIDQEIYVQKDGQASTGWVKSNDVKVKDKVRTLTGWEEVSDVVKRGNVMERMYDLQCAPLENYFANGVCVRSRGNQ